MPERPTDGVFGPWNEPATASQDVLLYLFDVGHPGAERELQYRAGLRDRELEPPTDGELRADEAWRRENPDPTREGV